MSLALYLPALPRIPRRYAPVLFAFFLSISLSGVLAAAITAVNTGLETGFVGRWLHAYALAWSFAFPAVTVVAPRVRALVERLTA